MARGERQQHALLAGLRRAIAPPPPLGSDQEIIEEITEQLLAQGEHEVGGTHGLKSSVSNLHYRAREGLRDFFHASSPGAQRLALLDFLGATASGHPEDKELREQLNQLTMALGRQGLAELSKRRLLSGETEMRLFERLNDRDPSARDRRLAIWVAEVAHAVSLRDRLSQAGPGLAPAVALIDEIVNDLDRSHGRGHLIRPDIAHMATMEVGIAAEALFGPNHERQRAFQRSRAVNIAEAAISQRLGPSPMGSSPPALMLTPDLIRRLAPEGADGVRGAFSPQSRLIFLREEDAQQAAEDAGQNRPNYVLVHEMIHARHGMPINNWRAGLMQRQAASYRIFHEGVAEELSDEICDNPQSSNWTYNAYEALIEALEKESGLGDDLTKRLANSNATYAATLAQVFGSSGSNRDQRQVNRIIGRFNRQLREVGRPGALALAAEAAADLKKKLG